MEKIKDYKFTKNDWAHFHDVILDATWHYGKINLSQSEMEKLFIEIPEEMKIDAYKYGMSDTPWRDELWRWYRTNKIPEIFVAPKQS